MEFQRIRELRKEQNWTQRQGADLLGIHRETYARYERGLRSPPLRILCGLADIYHTSVDYLVELTDQREAHTRSS